MVNKDMALTFSVRNNPGVYALLVGSGVSRGAEIPTGWEVIQDLIRKVAEADGGDPGPEPVEWYREEYDEEPRYDDLLEQLAPSKEDRQSLLKSYFEPTDEEREKGIKTPSQAHESIAWLVKQGYIQVIVTTNFDRLLEQALKEKGVTPTVIAKPSDAEGAAPLAHDEAAILKVNGDYKASTLKNTADELDSYDPEIERLIKQVLDEYGMIVCGWSGGWDSALRDLILSVVNRRYSMYWAAYSELGEAAEELVEHRDGNVISIDGGDNFFHSLKERVQALEDAGPGAPLSKEVARERTKRYLAREERKIDLADLIGEETEHLRDRLIDPDRFDLHVETEDEPVQERLNKYEKEVETLASIFCTCAYWGPEVPNTGKERMMKSLHRIASAQPDVSPRYKIWKRLAGYPTTLLMYSLGIAAVEADNWNLLYDILIETEANPYSSNPKMMIMFAHPFFVSGELSSRESTQFLYNRLEDALRNPLRELIPDDQGYEQSFEELEMLSDMVIVDLFEEIRGREIEYPRSRYWKLRLGEKIEAQGRDWGPLQAGFFGGELGRVETVVERYRD
ncbi:SIR2 family protein [Halococcus sp. PRR34]|uniref:SIR2 family protein n=1 Tax=Halococcus sp. PRR34 TaxID=3020830 RepID=UPI00235E289F|nr:SIR2 family protein [Halococcus sp. PRR34]